MATELGRRAVVSLFVRLGPAVFVCLLAASGAGPAAADPVLVAAGERRFVFQGVEAAGLPARDVTVVLPRAYDTRPRRRFPVLYAHDGQFALEGGLDLATAVDDLVAERAIDPWIVVAVDTTRRRTAELTSEVRRTGTLVLDVIKGLVDARFRTRPGPEDTALLGYSYGGLATLRIALRRPERVRRAVCMSSSFWWAGRRAVHELARASGPMPLKLWVDVGTRESGSRINYMVHDARAVRDLAIGKGMVLGRDLGYLEEPGAQHGHAWGGLRVRRALAFTLR